MARYETPDLIDLNDSAVGYGGSCNTGSNASWGCMPTGNRAVGACYTTGNSAGLECGTGLSGGSLTP